jgi:holliday junction resolvase YEN1
VARELLIAVLTPSISLWLMQCQSPFHYGHAQAGASPELRILFYRLARFLHFPVILLFVFDGEGRPSSKRGKKVTKTPNWLTERTQEMITLFGFHWYTVSAN